MPTIEPSSEHVERRTSLKIVAALAFFAFPVLGFAADFTVSVVSVLDGDTIEVLYNHRAERIRLNGIDCPEKGQAYGKKAKEATSTLVFGKEVSLQTYGKDKYGRSVADVLLSDGNAPGDVILEELVALGRKGARRVVQLGLLS